MTTIAIIGTGKVGSALGRRLAVTGHDVVFGARGPVDELIASIGERASAAPPGEAAARVDVVVLAVPGAVAVEAARDLGDLEGKVLVDATNPLKIDRGPVWDPPAAGSTAQALQAVLPKAHVVKGLNTFGAEFHSAPTVAGQPLTTFLAGDEGKDRVADLLRSAGFDPVDAGPLRNASLLENVAILWIYLAMVEGQGRDFAFQLVRR